MLIVKGRMTDRRGLSTGPNSVTRLCFREPGRTGREKPPNILRTKRPMSVGQTAPGYERRTAN